MHCSHRVPWMLDLVEVALTQQCRGRETTGVPVSEQVDLMASIFNIYHQSSA